LRTRALVTGYHGFIGCNLISTLNSSDFQSLGIDEEYLSEPDWTTNLQNRLSDFNPQVIFHVGACSNTLVNDVQKTMIMNYQSTKVLVDWSRANNSKMIYSSSAATYGTSGQFPSNLYGWSKYVGEGYVEANSGVALRYFNVYRPGEEDKGIMSSFAYQAFMAHKSNQPVKIFPGNPKRDFIYVKDVVEANIHAFRNFEQIKGKAYEVGSGRANSFESLLEILEIPYSYTPESSVPFGYQYHTESRTSHWMPGWRPRFDLVQGLEDYKSILQKNS